ncbi:unnamed protein product [Lactuca saligna]|uniref:Uncharacterized protein n=1 Tax=Lactuca saligna TaxID=75948 RepID=A0AA35ZW53_LACSI|nr:unnamed protein product [Lactuca saligna]
MKSERTQIIVSDIAGVVIVTYLLYNLVMSKGLTWVFCMYGVPLLIMRGALSVIDRVDGILNITGHNITNTHVTDHLFPKIPHYHAMEATRAIKPILKDYYRLDDTPILKALYKEAKECIYAKSDDNEEAKGVFWFDNKF